MYGSGAGRYPTATSVISDLFEIESLRGNGLENARPPFGSATQKGTIYDPEFTSMFVVCTRTTSTDVVADVLKRGGIPVQELSGKHIQCGPCEYSALMRLMVEGAPVFMIL
jgi:hypothetical protein